MDDVFLIPYLISVKRRIDEAGSLAALIPKRLVCIASEMAADRAKLEAFVDRQDFMSMAAKN